MGASKDHLADKDWMPWHYFLVRDLPRKLLIRTETELAARMKDSKIKSHGDNLEMRVKAPS
jgi:hypothetical protein